nr:MAG TPA: hypothetical protein [Caudoviricetes sp.]
MGFSSIYFSLYFHTNTDYITPRKFLGLLYYGC